MFEPKVPESKLYPADYKDVTLAAEKLSETILDDDDEWEGLTELINCDIELFADLHACMKDLVDKRRHCQADSSSVQAAVNGLVHVYERAAFRLAKERIK